MAREMPEELEMVPDNKRMGNVLARVFGGAHLVTFDYWRGLVAVWYGGSGFNVYDPSAWPESTGEVYHFNVMGCTDDGERSFEDRLNCAKVHLAGYGFDYVDPGGNALTVE